MHDPEQQPNIDRVADRIGVAIVEFARLTLKETGAKFHMQDLNDFVRGCCGFVAPDSPGRILRMLRKGGKLDYKVVSRADSLYEVLSVAP